MNVDFGHFYKEKVEPLVEGAALAAEFVADMAYDGAVYLSREVEKLTNAHLPKDYATIIQRAFNSLPAFAITHFTPFKVRVPCFLYWVYRDMSGRPFSKETTANIYTGLALSSAIDAAGHVIKAFAKRSPFYLSIIIVNIAVGLFWLSKAQQQLNPQAAPAPV